MTPTDLGGVAVLSDANPRSRPVIRRRAVYAVRGSTRLFNCRETRQSLGPSHQVRTEPHRGADIARLGVVQNIQQRLAAADDMAL